MTQIGLLSRLLRKIGLIPEARIQSAYRKGCDEGLTQGYRQARKELEAKILELERNMGEMRAELKGELKLSQGQINLLGRLVNQLTDRQSELTEETRTILRSMHRVLQDTNQTAADESNNH